MKKCPFCAEEIQEEAVKCRFCGEFLDTSVRAGSPVPWYRRTSVIILVFLAVGPFALPLIWMNPRFSRKAKIIVTAAVLLVTYYMAVFLYRVISFFTEYYKALF